MEPKHKADSCKVCGLAIRWKNGQWKHEASRPRHEAIPSLQPANKGLQSDGASRPASMWVEEDDLLSELRSYRE